MQNKKLNTFRKWICSLTAIVVTIHIIMMWTGHVEIPPKVAITLWAFGFAFFPLMRVFSEDAKE